MMKRLYLRAPSTKSTAADCAVHGHRKSVSSQLTPAMTSKLRSWQVEPANRLLDILQHSNAVDISDTGVGKTAHAGHVIAELKLPTLVIAPKIARSSWQRMLELFGTSASVTNWEAVAVGSTPFGVWEKPATAATRGKFYFVCQNCQRKYRADEKFDRCYATGNGIHCFTRKSVKHKRGRFSWSPQVKFIVADECHRAGAMKSLNAELVIAARRQGIKLLGLSATLATTPLGMRAWGYALDLFSNPDAGFYSWSRKHGCGKLSGIPGWHWLAGAERRREIMANINAEILPERGVRVRTSDIPGFPERQIAPEVYDLERENENEINEAYSEISPTHPLTEILRARQSVELAKVPLFVELATDAMAKGNSVCIFVCFRATIEALSKLLQCENIIDGSPENTRTRQDRIDAFQQNRERLLLLNSAAGGCAISLQDVLGVAPRVCLISPGFSSTEFKQVCGRTHRAGGKSPSVIRVVLAANTIEEKIKKTLDAKLNCLDALNDGDLTPLTPSPV